MGEEGEFVQGDGEFMGFGVYYAEFYELEDVLLELGFVGVDDRPNH